MKVFSWGTNSHNQLGHGHNKDLIVPTELINCPVSALEIASITGGGGHTLLVTKKGHIYSSGSNYKGECCGETKVNLNFTKIFFSSHRIVQATCGWDFSVALTDDGRVFTWGSNSFGQLGVGSIPKSSSPVEVFIGEIDPNTEQDIPLPVIQLAAGIRHCLILTENHEVFTWGAGRKGQLGFLDSDGKCLAKSEKPVKLSDLKDTVQVIAGAFHSGVLTTSGNVYIWGCNKYGQSTQTEPKTLPLPTEIPTSNFLLLNDSIKELHSGWSHLIILTKKCQLISWGRCDYGQLGRFVYPNSDGGNYDPKPQVIDAVNQPVFKVFCGAEHNVAIVDGGKLMCWGWNEHGMCGNGDEMNQKIPVPSLIPNLFHAINAGCGTGHTFVIVDR